MMNLNNTLGTAAATFNSARDARKIADLKYKVAHGVRHIASEPGKDKKDSGLKAACRGFEAMFLSMMYKEMRATVPKDPLLGESNAEKIFRDMQDEQTMKNIADAGGIGLADMMYLQLSPQVLAKPKGK